MILGLHIEVVLALAYALFLAATAGVLELVAWKSHRRAEDYRNAGFIYFCDLDYFECPAGHQLVQLETDYRRRTTFYRAPAGACNSCSLKLNCTDSDSGRIVERRLGAWVESELRRFHRGVSMTLLTLATVLLLVELFRYRSPNDRDALVMLILPIGLVVLKLSESLFAARQSRS